jgi:hypothetical protein
MIFDPDIAAFVSRVRELNLPRYETLSPGEAMAAARRGAAIQPPPIALSREIEIPFAGVIGAARDGSGAIGVAYNATISSVALPSDGSLNNLDTWKNYDVVNNSWTFSPKARALDFVG